MQRSLFILVVSAALSFGCGPKHLVTPPQQRAATATLFDDVQVLLIEEGRVEVADVLVENGKIIEVAEGIKAESAERVDGTGKTLMPGLIDSHVHIGSGPGAPPWYFAPPNGERELEALLYCGITTAVAAAAGLGTEQLDDRAEKGRLSAPVLLRASRIFTAPGGHPEPMIRAQVPSAFQALVLLSIRVQVDTPAYAIKTVDQEIARRRPELIKIGYNAMPEGGPHLSEETLRALVKRARERGVHPIVHVGSAAEAVAAAEAGAWMLMHTPWEDQFAEEDLARIKATGVPVVSTVSIFSTLGMLEADSVEFSALETEVVEEDVRDAFNRRPTNWKPPPMGDFVLKVPTYHENARANIKLLYEAGIPQFAGTDCGVVGVFHGTALHKELEHLVDIGVSNADALRMAMSNPAAHLYPDERVGVIETGARADLMLVEGNPLEDITATQAIVGVWQNGQRVR